MRSYKGAKRLGALCSMLYALPAAQKLSPADGALLLPSPHHSVSAQADHACSRTLLRRQHTSHMRGFTQQQLNTLEWTSSRRRRSGLYMSCHDVNRHCSTAATSSEVHAPANAAGETLMRLEADRLDAKRRRTAFSRVRFFDWYRTRPHTMSMTNCSSAEQLLPLDHVVNFITLLRPLECICLLGSCLERGISGSEYASGTSTRLKFSLGCHH